MKAVRIILGILAIILGVICLFDPFSTQFVYAYIAVIAAGIIGIVGIIDYAVNNKKRKKAGIQAAVGGVSLAASIICVILFVLSLLIPTFTIDLVLIGATFLLVSLTVDGIMNIIGAFTYREYDGGMRVCNVLLGILMILGANAGFRCFPLIISMMGVFTGIGTLVAGISLITNSCTTEQA